MKKILFLLLLPFHLFATTYYVSNAGSNAAAGTTTGTSWQTISKVNGFTFASGDIVLFNRGDVWNEALIPPASNLTFGYYGSGALPVITGLTTLVSGSWVNDGGGIWHINVPSATSALMIVTIDGNIQRMGRFPNYNASNSGYLQNTAFSGLTITSSASSSTTNWTGAEVVIRKNHWILDRCVVTGHSGGVITYTNPSGSSYAPKVGYGLFFQDDIRTLDQFGEWFLNPSTKDLSMYFGAAVPSSYVIKASVIDRVINCASKNSLTFQNLNIEGANSEGIYSNLGQNIIVNNCTLNNNYNGINGSILNATVTYNTIANTLNNALKLVDWGTSYTGAITASSNTIIDNAMFSGMSGSGDGMGLSLSYNGNNADIDFNRIDSSGYMAISFVGDYIRVRSNYISNYCYSKDDGAGIYTASYAAINVGREISSNIIINGIGTASDGTPNYTTPGTTFDTHGIYLDEFANNVYVYNNFVGTCLLGAGIFLNNANNDVIRSNTVYNVRYGWRVSRMPDQAVIRNLTFVSNILYPTGSNFLYWNGSLNTPTTTSIQADITAMFTKVDSNYYRNDITDPFDWFYHLTNGGTYVDPASISFSSWPGYIGMEANSFVLSTATPSYVINPTGSSVVQSFSGFSKKDAYGSAFSNSYTLPAYKGAILFDNGSLTRNYFIRRRHL